MKQLLLLLAIATAVTATTSATAQNFWQRIDQTFKLSSTASFDTTYYQLSPYGWMININNSNAGYLVQAHQSTTNTRLSAHSDFNDQIGITAGYRNLILGYSFLNPIGDTRDMTLAIAGNGWGVEYRKLRTDNFSGTLSTPTSADIDIAPHDLYVQSRYLRAYHIFNRKHFSLTAAIDQRNIQLRSAGSIIFYTNYTQNQITINNPTLTLGINDLAYSQASLGLGYCYNYTPNRGKLLFHAMLTPMFSVIKHYQFDTTYTVASQHDSFLNLMARLAVTYHINDHLGLTLQGYINNVNLRTQNHFSLHQNDYLVKLTLATRF